jgi:alanine dehydrogenase
MGIYYEYTESSSLCVQNEYTVRRPSTVDITYIDWALQTTATRAISNTQDSAVASSTVIALAGAQPCPAYTQSEHE